jgi:hypothetical protein
VVQNAIENKGMCDSPFTVDSTVDLEVYDEHVHLIGQCSCKNGCAWVDEH